MLTEMQMILPFDPEMFSFYKRRILNLAQTPDKMKMTNYPISLKCDNVCFSEYASFQKKSLLFF